MSRLKAETRALHEETESRVDLSRRLKDETSYISLLAQFYSFYVPLEKQLASISDYEAVGLSLGERLKAPLLTADLAWLGVDPAGIKLATDLPTVRNLSDALGCLYVIEGSTLGGQIIRRIVTEKLGYTEDGGCRFFAGYKDRTGLMWEQFRQAASAHATTSDREDQMVRAAVETFDKLGQILAEEPIR